MLNAHKYKNIKKFFFFKAHISLECYIFPLININMPTIVGILTFMGRKYFMLSWVEHEIFLYPWGLEAAADCSVKELRRWQN